MPAHTLSLADALARIARLGPAVVRLQSGTAQAFLEGTLRFEERGPLLVMHVGSGARIEMPAARIRQGVFGEKEGVAQLQLFDAGYDRVALFTFPSGLEQVRALAQELDGNDFEIG